MKKLFELKNVLIFTICLGIELRKFINFTDSITTP